MFQTIRRAAPAIFMLLMFMFILGADDAATEPPKIGDKVADFTLKNIDGEEVTLSKLTDQGPVALIVLRGYPGYHCPLCTRQFGDLLAHADHLTGNGANILFVFPGSADQLDERAKEFLRGKELPKSFHFVTDPDYKFTNLYHLRWDAPRETAYPSTFILSGDRKVAFAKVSTSHGGRTTAAQILAELKKLDHKVN